ncbi:hypothetical protein BGY98DRAFT_1022197, partial [Russula aff. rugulosa BPL654]
VFSSSHLLTVRPPRPDPIQGFVIFLANNKVRTLPQEFFKLSNLTVPSRRGKQQP